MLDKYLKNVFFIFACGCFAFASQAGYNSFLIDRSDLANASADAIIAGINPDYEMLELQMQLEDICKNRDLKVDEISDAGNIYTAQSTYIKQLNGELDTIETNLAIAENKLLDAGARRLKAIQPAIDDITKKYNEATINYIPSSIEFQKVYTRYRAAQRLLNRYQAYKKLYDIRRILSDQKDSTLKHIEAYAELLELEPGNPEAIEYCTKYLTWNINNYQGIKSDEEIEKLNKFQKERESVLNKINTIARKNIISLYNNGIEITRISNLGIELCWVPKGQYLKQTIHDEGIKRKKDIEVKISSGFWISRYEITVGQYLDFLNSTTTFESKEYTPLYMIDSESQNFKLDNYNCYQLADDMFLGDNDKPIILVSHQNALKFCQWLSDFDTPDYSLPTESQWELAARADTDTAWHFGTDINKLDQYSWYGKLSRLSTMPVGMLKPNLFGLYDMYGNAWEWCLDWYSSLPYPYQPDAIIDPVGPDISTAKIIRGGSWQSQPEKCSSFGRHYAAPVMEDKAIGFRIIEMVNFSN